MSTLRQTFVPWRLADDAAAASCYLPPMTNRKLPSREEILQWIRDNPAKSSRREIARAFGIKGAERIELKRMLRELTAEGHVEKRRRSYTAAGDLPPVCVLRVEADADGDLFGLPVEWDGEEEPPRVLLATRDRDPALGEGDRILARLTPTPDAEHPFEGRLIRRIGRAPERVLGIYRVTSEGGRLVPVDKRQNREFIVPPGESGGAKDGELVEAEPIGKQSRLGLGRVRIVERLGDPHAPRAVSLIAIHAHGIPDRFSEEALAEAAAAEPVTELGDREDLRHLPLFTIDPWDARDHDDAICAVPDPDPKNEGGFIVWVAIADVAHYVRPGSALDREARNRGNSTYFPDRVVPMLPDALSGDLCSLHEGVDRPCIAVKVRINTIGERLEHAFVRGMMRSPASLTYQQAQAAAEGRYDEKTEPLAGPIADLFAAYAAAAKAREARQPLHLDLPEREIVLSEEGKVLSVAFKERLEAHRLVEEFMIMANVCAAETLERYRRKFLYRVHEPPAPDKLETLRELAESLGLKFPKGQTVRTAQINRILDAAARTHDPETISLIVLRSMTQAYYSPHNQGHFGLNLKRYAHFTSPIRRYADLVVHRALIAAHGWGDGRDAQTKEEVEELEATGGWISMTERRSMLAERDTTDRYLAAYLSEHVGEEMSGRISGIARFGIFVKLDETGADGIVPISQIGNEYWVYSREENTLTGDRSGRVLRVGMPVRVRLVDAQPLTGGVLLELLDVEGKALPMPHAGRKASSKPKKTRRKVVRRRKAR